MNIYNRAKMQQLLLSILENDPELKRLDLTARLFEQLSESEKDTLIEQLPNNNVVQTIHLSGQSLTSVLSDHQLILLIQNIGQMQNVNEYFLFRGDTDLPYLSFPPQLQVLMMWQFDDFSEHFIAEMRQHKTIQRVTFHLPCPPLPKYQLPWAYLDKLTMALASMEDLQVLQIRCVSNWTTDDDDDEPWCDSSSRARVARQQDAILSPDAFALLLQSRSIKSLYLENVGLMDDHIDLLLEQVIHNHALQLLDVKENWLTEDALYTLGQLLQHPQYPAQFQSMDVSGVQVTDAAGDALAQGMQANQVVTHLELEGTLSKYQDEFDIQLEHKEKPWMKLVYSQLRLNRAQCQKDPEHNLRDFVDCLSSVSDHLEGLFYFVRTYGAKYPMRSVQYDGQTNQFVL